MKKSLLRSPRQGKKQKAIFKLGQLVRTTDIKKLFSKGDSTNWCYKLYTITEVIHYNIPSYGIIYLAERDNRKLLGSTKLTADEIFEKYAKKRGNYNQKMLLY